MIYDCGSDSLSQELLKKRVNSDLGNTQKIGATCDILFISHFDRDHINGVQFLDPDIVVIPFLSKTQKILLRTYNAIFGDVYDLKFVENPQEVFPDAKIISVYPAQLTEEDDLIPDHADDDPHIEIFSLRDGVAIDLINSSSHSLPPVIASGIPIKVKNDDTLIWEYIPFNPNWDKYAARFRQKVLEEHIDWNILSRDSKGSFIKKYFSVLRAIFNSMRPKNAHSLVVYSNSVEKSWINYRSMRYWSCMEYYCDTVPGGCIYFGDATVEHGWLNNFYHQLEDGRLTRVGTLQVPHHGSYLNNRQSILPKGFPRADPMLCIISAGEQNVHGHPSAKVIQNLESKKTNVVLVTESSSSLIYGNGRII